MNSKKLNIFLLFVICLFMTGCGEEKVKTVATLDQFSDAASNNGFTVNDNMATYANVDYILESKKAMYDDVVVEMAKYIDNSHAEQAQENHIESFDLLKNTGAHAVKDKGSNYYHYTLVSNGRYMVSIRVDNTLLFCKVMLDDKELIDKIIEELDY